MYVYSDGRGNIIASETELYHHGVLGQKWGVRRYQNPDGTYTDEGKARLNKTESNESRESNQVDGSTSREKSSSSSPAEAASTAPKKTDYKKVAAIGAAAVTATMLGVYVYKNRDKISNQITAGKKAFEDYKNQRVSNDDSNNKTLGKLSDFAKKNASQIAEKAKEKVKDLPDKISKKALEVTDKAIDRAIDGAIAGAGMYVASKILAKRDTINTGNEFADKVIKGSLGGFADGVSSGSSKGSGSSGSGKDSATSKGSSSPHPNDTQLSTKPFQSGISALGQPPAKTVVDKQSEAYTNLFKLPDGSARSDAQRAAIKQLIRDGYSVAQINSIIYKTEHS